MKRLTVLVVSFFIGCTGAVRGPDKQFSGGLQGAVTGAGAGAITGFQLGVGSGPGALVGAGLGAVAGGIHGATRDSAEEGTLKLSKMTQVERQRAVVHETLQDHLTRRLELHPSRDIYPADLFFNGDDTKLCAQGLPLVRELARLSKHRMPWSRLAVTAYVRGEDTEARGATKEESYSMRLAELRAREIADHLVRSGLQPRRIEARAVVVDAPLLKDPLDHPDRYSQAIELVYLDK